MKMNYLASYFDKNLVEIKISEFKILVHNLLFFRHRKSPKEAVAVVKLVISK